MTDQENNKRISIARPCGEGNDLPVRRYKDKYEVAVPVGRYGDGRIKYKRELADTEREAIKRERELLEEIRDAVFRLQPIIPPKNTKLFKQAIHEWLEGKRSEVRLKTLERYKLIAKLHLIPYFGEMSICNITEEDVKKYLKTNPNCGTTLRQHYVILENVLKAEGIDLLKDIERPKKNEKAINCIKDPYELADFVMSFKDTIMFLPAYIAANTGMRFSEVAGLKWRDIDLNNGYISVDRSLHWDKESGKRYWYVEECGKTKGAKRTIKINKHDIDVLKETKERQNGKYADFVCLDTRGFPIAKDTHGSGFRRSARVRGYDISFHSLRHSHATLLILIYKVPIKTVSRRLGHSDISVTLGIYTGIIQEQDELAADAMEDAFSHVSGTKRHENVDPE